MVTAPCSPLSQINQDGSEIASCAPKKVLLLLYDTFLFTPFLSLSLNPPDPLAPLDTRHSHHAQDQVRPSTEHPPLGVSPRTPIRVFDQAHARLHNSIPAPEHDREDRSALCCRSGSQSHRPEWRLCDHPSRTRSNPRQHGCRHLKVKTRDSLANAPRGCTSFHHLKLSSLS